MMRMIDHQLSKAKEWLEIDKSGKREFYLGRYQNLDFRWVRIQDPLAEKYFPEYWFFIQKNNGISFALHKSGEITLLGKGLPLNKAYETSPELKLKVYSDFLAENKILVDTPEKASDMVNLSMLIHEERGGYHHSESWQLDAKKVNDEMAHWLVVPTYIGDPNASIIIPPNYQVFVDDQCMATDIRTLGVSFVPRANFCTQA